MKYFFVPILILMVACQDKVTVIPSTDNKLEQSVYNAIQNVKKSSHSNRKKALREFLVYANKADGAIAEEYGAFAFDYVENNTKDFFAVLTKNDSTMIADWAKASVGEIEILAEDQKQKDSILHAVRTNHDIKIQKNNAAAIEAERFYFKKLKEFLNRENLPGTIELKQKAEPFKQGDEMSDPNNTLEPKIETLELEYVVFGCACANWIKKEDLEQDKNNLNKAHYFFIEPENPKLGLPQNFDALKNRIKVTGQFYKNKDYPKGTLKGEEDLEKAKVFRYRKIELITK